MNDLTLQLGYFYDLDIQSWGFYYGDCMGVAIYKCDPVKQIILWNFYWNNYDKNVTV